MIKWIVIAVAAYILYRLFANDILKKRKKNEKELRQINFIDCRLRSA